MTAPPEPPKQYANQVIRLMVDHLFGSDMITDPMDYMVLRQVFRTTGGSWEKLFQGDPGMVQKLSALISAWGTMPNRIRTSQRVI